MQKGRVWIGAAIAATVAIILVTGGKTTAGESRMIPTLFKLDGIAGQIFEKYRMQGGENALQSYRSRGYETMENMVRVVIELEDLRGISPEVSRSAIAQAVQYWGGRVEAEHGRLTRVLLPVESLGDISLSPYVGLIRTPLKPYEAGVTSEGVARSGANVFQNAPSFGGDAQVKIAVLDSGFKGYSSLLGSELPASVQTKNYRTDGNFEYSLHGSACAEIVHDMAPGAEIYLVAINDDVGFHQAVDWLIQEKVDVISCSLVWMCDAGAGDGTGPICEDVKKADAAGIVWVQAMGNFGKQYWSGQFIPSSNNTVSHHNFGLSDIKMSDSTKLAIKATGSFEIYLSWDDWGTWNGSQYVLPGNNESYYFELFQCYSINGSWMYFDSSASVTGTIGKGKWPVRLSGVVSKISPTQWWGLRITRSMGTKNSNFRLFILGAEVIERTNILGSYGIPGESKEAFSVIGVNTSDVLYPMNSFGPPRYSASDIAKPDLAGYSSISTISMGIFEGTSAAAAHVAGAFGLMKSKLPFNNADLKQLLRKRAIQWLNPGPEGWNYYSGYGRLNLLKK